MLNEAPYGAYAVDMRQTISFWNRSAERILGHRAEDAVGQRCYQVLQNICGEASAPICMTGCPFLRLAKEGRNPPVAEFLALCASDRRKPVTVTPLIVPDAQAGRTLLLYLLHEKSGEGQSNGVAGAAGGIGSNRSPSASPSDLTSGLKRPETGPLTVREFEVLRLVSLGMGTREISGELSLSTHTVRNHVRNARQKLSARTKLDAVLAAQRLGLL